MEEKEGILLIAKMLISGENYKSALNHLKNGLKKYPNDPGILTQLSVVYELLEKFDKSKDMLEKALKYDSNYARAHYIKGIDFQNEGNLKQAEKEFLLAIENYPKYSNKMIGEHISESHTNLGSVYYLQGKHRDAINEWRLAVTYDPNNCEAKNNLRQFSDKPIEKPETGEDCEYFIDRGVELSEEGRLAESIKTLKKAYLLKPDHPLVHYNIGLVYGKLGNFENARKHLEKFLKLEPNHAEAHKLRELIEKIKRGDFK